jgi:hypothetical protein
MSHETREQKLKCPECAATGTFSYKEAETAPMPKQMIDPVVPEGFHLANYESVGHKVKLACNKCGVAAKRIG